MRWYINRNGETIGPVDESVIIQWGHNNQLLADMFVCAENGGNWVSIENSPFSNFVLRPNTQLKKSQIQIASSIVFGMVVIVVAWLLCGNDSAKNKANIEPVKAGSNENTTPPRSYSRTDELKKLTYFFEWVSTINEYPEKSFGGCSRSESDEDKNCTCYPKGDPDYRKCEGYVSFNNGIETYWASWCSKYGLYSYSVKQINLSCADLDSIETRSWHYATAEKHLCKLGKSARVLIENYYGGALELTKVIIFHKNYLACDAVFARVINSQGM